MSIKINISTQVKADLALTWHCFTAPEHIMQWNHASDDWHCPAATNDLRVGAHFSFTMAAKDGSFSFDFGGEYTEIVQHERIRYKLGDAREVEIDFVHQDGITTVTEIFDTEDQNSADLQRAGWLAILDNFKKHTESI